MVKDIKQQKYLHLNRYKTPESLSHHHHQFQTKFIFKNFCKDNIMAEDIKLQKSLCFSDYKSPTKPLHTVRRTPMTV